jgi:hypothetical protein
VKKTSVIIRKLISILFHGMIRTMEVQYVDASYELEEKKWFETEIA